MPRFADGVELGVQSVSQQDKPVIDLSRDALQFAALAFDELLLLGQLALHQIHIAGSDKLAYLRQWQVKNAQVADGVEGGELSRSVVAIAARVVDMRRLQQPQLLVMTQCANAQVKQARHLTNAEQAVGMFAGRISHGIVPFGRKQDRVARLASSRYATSLSKVPRRLSAVNATTQMAAERIDPHGEAMPMGNSVSE